MGFYFCQSNYKLSRSLPLNGVFLNTQQHSDIPVIPVLQHLNICCHMVSYLYFAWAFAFLKGS